MLSSTDSVGTSEVLLDEAAPEPVGPHRRLEGQVLTLDPDTTARIGLVVSGQDLDQGGLPRAVLPEERVDLARFDGHAHRGKGLGARERL